MFNKASLYFSIESNNSISRKKNFWLYTGLFSFKGFLILSMRILIFLYSHTSTSASFIKLSNINRKKLLGFPVFQPVRIHIRLCFLVAVKLFISAIISSTYGSMPQICRFYKQLLSLVNNSIFISHI